MTYLQYGTVLDYIQVEARLRRSYPKEIKEAAEYAKDYFVTNQEA